MPSKTTNPSFKLAQPPKSKSFYQLPSLELAKDFSLTAGTDIPSPPSTPPREEADENELGRAPTPGGGPLSSHPTTPTMPGAFPSTPTSTELKANRVLGRDPNDNRTSPSQLSKAVNATAFPNNSVNTTITGGAPPSRRNSTSMKGGMKRLFSFRSLYSNSNSSSTDCFAGATGPTNTQLGRGMNSIDQPFRPASSVLSNRPDSPMTTTSKTTGSTSPGLKKKRSSGAWFSSATGGRRKSGFFMVGRVDENGMMSNGRVDSMDHDTDSMKENREPPPTIPEVQMDTDIGGEELFRNIR